MRKVRLIQEAKERIQEMVQSIALLYIWRGEPEGSSDLAIRSLLMPSELSTSNKGQNSHFKGLKGEKAAMK